MWHFYTILAGDVEMADESTLTDYNDVAKAKVDLKDAQQREKDVTLFQEIKAKIDHNCFRAVSKPSEQLPTGQEHLYLRMKAAAENVATNQSIQTFNYFVMGKICFYLSKSNQGYFKRFEIDLGKTYGKRFCQSLVAFYMLCLQFPALKYCGIGFRKFHGKLGKIREMIIKDSDKNFWLRK